jgi:hypothetical protein
MKRWPVRYILARLALLWSYSRRVHPIYYIQKTDLGIGFGGILRFLLSNRASLLARFGTLFQPEHDHINDRMIKVSESFSRHWAGITCPDVSTTTSYELISALEGLDERCDAHLVPNDT